MKTLPELKRAVFFDRDGVLNRKPAEHDSVKNFGEFFWNEGAQELVKNINNLNFLVIVISNQRGVALGRMSKDFVEALHVQMNKDLGKIGARIDAFYYCPHDVIDRCLCRKPAPGMFLTAASEWGIDLSKSFMIGDRESDIVAAQSAGCKGIKIETDSIKIQEILTAINL